MTPCKVVLVKPVTEGEVLNHIPTGLCYLSSYLTTYGPPDVTVQIQTLSLHDAESITVLRPDVVGFTAYTYNYRQTIALAHRVRELLPKAAILLGGPHITNAPWSMDEVFDLGVIGEGERTFSEVIRALSGGDDPRQCQGVQYFEDGRIVSNEPTSLIEPLDTIPFPDRDRIADIESIITITHPGWFSRDNMRSLQLTTSRGCPYKCIFCQPSAMWKKLRMHSAEYVADEIVHIRKKYAVNAVLVEDDLFTGSRKRIIALVELLGRRNLLGTMKFYIAARTALIDQEWIELFRDLGVIKVEFGIESGSDRIASYLKNQNESREVNERAIRMLNDADIAVFASFIAGAPSETISDFKQTRSLMRWIQRNHRNNSAGINILTPLPGTAIWDYAVERGIIVPDQFDWDIFATRSSLARPDDDVIYLNEHIPRKQLLRMIRRLSLEMRLGTPAEFMRALPRRTRKVIGRLISKKK